MGLVRSLHVGQERDTQPRNVCRRGIVAVGLIAAIRNRADEPAAPLDRFLALGWGAIRLGRLAAKGVGIGSSTRALRPKAHADEQT